MPRHCLILLAAILTPGIDAHADEGMWTPFNFPSAAVRQKYHVDIDDRWLQRAQRATARLEGGCTGSFISGDGLVLTNHHCVSRCLADHSTADRDLLSEGFNAGARSGEKQCTADMLSVLIATEDITARVNAATAGLGDAKANEVRKQTLSRLEAECTAAAAKNRATGPLACESVNFYQGGQYFLYKYRRYDDVRLVFAPHDSVAVFGGDPDNFNFPRWSVDFSLLRVYANGRPAHTPDHLRWRAEGPAPGEPVFVVGHPAMTDRLLSMAQLEFQRDTYIPAYIARNAEYRGRLIQWGKTGTEPARIIQDPLFYSENSLKVFRGLQQALLDDQMLALRRRSEQQLRDQAGPATAEAWDHIAQAEDRYRQIFERHLYLESGVGFNSRLFKYARQLVRVAQERARPNELRLREYADSSLPKVQAWVLADSPIHPDFENVTLSFSLDKLRESLGPDDPVTRQLLGSESPDSLAARLIAGTSLADVAVRKALWEGGSAAIEASTDPMIVLARQIDPVSREVRRIFEDEVQAPIAAAQESIARARFAAYGTSIYPDANFTLRISYGAVRSWQEKGADVPPFTTLARMYERATGKDPFRLPSIWLQAKDRLDPHTPFNYVTTNDIVGGNSGSPVIDAAGRLVGVAFDGNIHSIAGSYWYNERNNRMIAVHPRIIMTALRDVYGADWIADEILRTHAARGKE